MEAGPILRTERLTLRRWRADDRAPFAQMNADPTVMELFPRVLTPDESTQFIAAIERRFDAEGFGLWAVDVTGAAPFVGFVGLWPPSFPAHFTPAVEIGWRLAADHWGHGYATEGARAALSFGFEALGLEEIVSFTTPRNVRSLRVMQRLGMQHDPADDFDHPSFPTGDPLRRHVLYRLQRSDWPGR